jgi:hypothetical protein
MKEEHIFVTGFCGQCMMVLMTKTYIFADEVWFHLNGYINDENNKQEQYYSKTDFGGAPS